MYNYNAIFTLFTQAWRRRLLRTSAEIMNYINNVILIFIFVLNNRNSSSYAARLGELNNVVYSSTPSDKLECFEWIGRLPNKAKHSEHNAKAAVRSTIWTSYSYNSRIVVVPYFYFSNIYTFA